MNETALGWLRLACALIVPVARYLSTGGAMLSATYFPLVWIVRPWVSFGILALTLAAWGAIVLTPAFPALVVFKWALLALLVAAAAAGGLVDPGVAGSLRARFFHSFGPALRAACGLGGIALLSLLLFRNAPVDFAVRYGLTLLLIYRALRSAVPPLQAAGTHPAAAGLLLAGALAFALLVLEGGARVLFPERGPAASFMESHPVYGILPRPGAETRTWRPAEPDETPPVFFDVKISSQGLRDREYGPKADGEFRILLLGDSFTMGWGVSEEQMPSRQLERALRERISDRPITVINAGCGGFGPWQQRGLLLERGFPLEPDLVILQLMMGNDVQDTLRQVDKVLSSYSVPTEAFWQMHRHPERWDVRVDRWLWRSSRVYQQYMFSTGSNLGAARLLSSLRFWPRPPLPPSAARPWFIEFCLKEWYPLLQEGWEMLQEDVTAIQRDCAERNVAFVAYVQPTSHYSVDAYWQNFVREYKMDEALYDRDKEIDVPERFFADSGIPFIPMGRVFRGAKDPKALFLRSDGHLSPAGCAFWAELTADSLCAARTAELACGAVKE